VHAHALEAMDRAAAAHSVEPRYPFFDVPLVEFCLAMPSDQKLRHGWSRWVMRRAMEGILPPEVQWRPGKSNLGPVLTQALHRNGRAVEHLLRDPGAIVPYVDLLALRERWEHFRRAPSPKDVMPMWVALVLERGLALGTQVDLSASRGTGLPQ
jgi:asparagine synthase (glutamine-hydrolysing)